jgi:hypothetical protein
MGGKQETGCGVNQAIQNAKDKEQALREILSVTDYSTFLEKSGYTDQFVE